MSSESNEEKEALPGVGVVLPEYGGHTRFDAVFLGSGGLSGFGALLP